jgi:hypothetical protein
MFSYFFCSLLYIYIFFFLRSPILKCIHIRSDNPADYVCFVCKGNQTRRLYALFRQFSYDWKHFRYVPSQLSHYSKCSVSDSTLHLSKEINNFRNAKKLHGAKSGEHSGYCNTGICFSGKCVSMESAVSGIRQWSVQAATV